MYVHAQILQDISIFVSRCGFWFRDCHIHKMFSKQVWKRTFCKCHRLSNCRKWKFSWLWIIGNIFLSGIWLWVCSIVNGTNKFQKHKDWKPQPLKFWIFYLFLSGRSRVLKLNRKWRPQKVCVFAVFLKWQLAGGRVHIISNSIIYLLLDLTLHSNFCVHNAWSSMEC